MKPKLNIDLQIKTIYIHFLLKEIFIFLRTFEKNNIMAHQYIINHFIFYSWLHKWYNFI